MKSWHWNPALTEILAQARRENNCDLTCMVSLQGHVPVTHNMPMGMLQVYGISPSESYRVSFGPDPSHPTSPGPHLDVGEHQAGSKPADCWGQQNHSLKQKVLRGGRTSWVSANAHSTQPSQPHSPQPRASLCALSRNQLSAPSPRLPGTAPPSKALPGATCPSHTSLKSRQEHKTFLLSPLS